MAGAPQHNRETIAEALMLLSYFGNLEKTVQALKDRGVTISRQGLAGWRDKYSELWEEAETRMKTEILDRVADRAERFIVDAQDAEEKLLQQLMANREELPAKEVANALRNVSVSKAIAMEKVVMPVRGRPTQIVEHIDLYALLNDMNKIAASIPKRPELETITSTAVEDD